jgi:hypothetical protein
MRRRRRLLAGVVRGPGDDHAASSADGSARLVSVDAPAGLTVVAMLLTTGRWNPPSGNPASVRALDQLAGRS